VEALQGCRSTVTPGSRFFPDAEAVNVLRTTVFPELVHRRPSDEPIRIWTPGCSTGEDAYSLAITFIEFVGDISLPIRLFATDRSEDAIRHARVGRYPLTIAPSLSPKRRRRFFARTHQGYQIVKLLREKIVFARHDVLADPPFARIDLIACHDLVIDDPPSIQRILSLFHYALRPGGFLWLRSADRHGLSELFDVVDSTHNIFAKKPVATSIFKPPVPTSVWPPTVGLFPAFGRDDANTRNRRRGARRLTACDDDPRGMLVTEDLDVASRLAPLERRTEGNSAKRVRRLRQELSATRDDLHSSIEQHQATNDELCAANETIQTTNAQLLNINEELQTTREQLVESANRSQQLLDTIPLGVYAVDAHGAITNYNWQAAQLWGRSPEPDEIEERLWQPTPRTKGVPRARVVTAVKHALRSGTPVRGREAIIERQDGSRIPVHINVDPIRDIGGRITGAIVAFQDVTHLKRAEAALTADHRKDQFVAMLAHELRNPLAAVRLTLAVMRRDTDAGISVANLDVIDQEVADLARLVNDLLDVTRMRQGKVNLLKAPLDLRSVAESAIQAITPAVHAKGLTLSVNMSREPVYVDGDARRLEQAVFNLLDNALKYTDVHGRIAVSMPADSVEAVLRVSDTGIGIRPEMLPCIFDPFAQDDSSLTRSRGGLGIGLFMVAKLAEMHGGSIEAYSAGLGQGAEFRLRLPRRSAGQSRLPHAKPAGREAAPILPVLRMLVVEDNVEVGDKLTTLLRHDGHEVRLERDGCPAIAAAEAFRPSVILLDIGLPIMDGYQVARQIRQQPGLKNVVIIGLSGYTNEESHRRSIDAGFDELLGKPIDLDVLKATMARFVSRNDPAHHNPA
jgi:PAS domain S-box-containing protein